MDECCLMRHRHNLGHSVSYLRKYKVDYLKSIETSDIRQKCRVKYTDGTKTFTFEKFSVDELKTSIRNVIKPENKVSVDVDILPKNGALNVDEMLM